MEEENKNSEGLPANRIRTYQDAIQEALETQQMSSAGLLMAEQKKRDDFKKDTEALSISNPRNKILMALSFILIISAVFLIAFAIVKSSNKKPPETDFIIRSKYFITEKMIEISASQLSRNTLARIKQATTEPLTNNQIANLVLTREAGTKSVYSTEDFLALLNSRAPENIRKVLDPEFLLGIHKSSENSTFVLFRVTNYENAYAGMLTWESALARDLEGIFIDEIAKARITQEEEIIPETIIEEDSGTNDEIFEPKPNEATSTFETKQRTIDNTRIWHDRVIRNTDTRALLDINGKVVFFYSIIDNEYIFFGSKEETFAEVMRRVRTAKLIR